MPTDNAWYTRQSTISKLLTYAAILILVACAAFAIYLMRYSTLAEAMTWAVGGIVLSAFLAALSAIIDLLIVQAVALHDLRNK